MLFHDSSLFPTSQVYLRSDLFTFTSHSPRKKMWIPEYQTVTEEDTTWHEGFYGRKADKLSNTKLPNQTEYQCFKWENKSTALLAVPWGCNALYKTHLLIGWKIKTQLCYFYIPSTGGGKTVCLTSDTWGWRHRKVCIIQKEWFCVNWQYHDILANYLLTTLTCYHAN